MPSADANVCCAACATTSSCVGFVVWAGNCYFKGAGAATTTATNRIAYLVAHSPPPPPIAPLPVASPPSQCGLYVSPLANTELNGDSLSSVVVSGSVDACCSTCSSSA
eukprot:6622257-Prymnesium_polylepis.1